MKTVFKVGMKVYDEIFHKGLEGKIVDIEAWDNDSSEEEVLIVHFDKFSYSYSIKGALVAFGSRKLNYQMPISLSTSPYTVGEIKQEPSIPTIEEAVAWCRENYSDYRENFCGHYINEEYENAFDALNSLIILREYYNEGWKSDWDSDKTIKHTIETCCNDDFVIEPTSINYPRVLSFKSKKIRNKFFKEQRELLEIAKPLL